MEKEGLENLAITRDKWEGTYLTNLCEWMKERGSEGFAKSETLLRGTRDRKLSEAMFAHVLKRHIA